MRRVGILILLVLYAVLGTGQDIILLTQDSTYLDSKYYLEIGAEADLRSNALNNSFYNAMIYGGLIDENLKNQIDDKLTGLNRLGLTSGAGLSYWSFNDSLFRNENIGILLNVDQRIDGYVSFTDDLFNLVYRGNSGFVGKEADLSKLNSGVYVYQKYGFGIFDKRNFSSIKLSMVNGQRFYETRIKEASLYTDPNLDSLVLAYQGTVSFSDTSNTQFTRTNGIGATIDLKANIPLLDETGFLSFEINNIGFINWYNTSLSYDVDSSFTYAGIDLQDILDSSDNSFEIPSLTDTLNIQGTKKRITSILPGSARVSLNKSFKKNNFFEVGIQVMGNRVYTPMIYVGYDYLFNNRSLISAKVRYGGYSNLRIGADFEHRWKELYFRVGTEDLPGLFYRDLYGKGAYVTLGKFIGKK